jgi:hypothetical protein
MFTKYKRKLQFQNKLQYPNSNDQNRKTCFENWNFEFGFWIFPLFRILLICFFGIFYYLDLEFPIIWYFGTLAFWHFPPFGILLLYRFGIFYYYFGFWI